jgi:hypothetical protein
VPFFFEFGDDTSVDGEVSRAMVDAEPGIGAPSGRL